MAKILAPNKEYTGVSASVPFCNGVGETDNSTLISWFKEHGYVVEEPKGEIEEVAGNIEEPKEEKKPPSRAKK